MSVIPLLSVHTLVLEIFYLEYPFHRACCTVVFEPYNTTYFFPLPLEGRLVVGILCRQQLLPTAVRGRGGGGNGALPACMLDHGLSYSGQIKRPLSALSPMRMRWKTPPRMRDIAFSWYICLAWANRCANQLDPSWCRLLWRDVVCHQWNIS